MLFNDENKKIIVSGHRGIKAFYPENTFVSYKKAIELGVDQLEIDINMTKDRSLIIMHDNTVDRTTNGTGLIRNLDINQIKNLDAGIYLGEKYKGEKVPLLSELLEFLNINNKDITLNVEIKDLTFECVDLTIKMLFDYGFRNKFVIACWDANITEYAYRKYGVMTQGFPKSIFKNYSNYTYGYIYAVGIPMEMVSKKLVDEYISLNIQPWAWCPDDEESVNKCIESGIKLLTCNNPEPAILTLRKLKLHK